MHSITIHSPLDEITIFEHDNKIIAIESGRCPEENPCELLNNAKNQLIEYFTGNRKSFDLPIDMGGTEFQKKVFNEMLKIPYGETKSYGEIAKILNSSAQAVGQACAQNHLPIIVPCHRIISASGKIGGYSAFYGVESKINLLKLEGVNI